MTWRREWRETKSPSSFWLFGFLSLGMVGAGTPYKPPTYLTVEDLAGARKIQRNPTPFR